MVTRVRRRSGRFVAGTTLVLVAGAGGVLTSSAAGSSAASSFVSITPCRLLDTRPGTDNVGSRSTPLGVNDTYATAVRGTNGNCTIPTSATGVSMNVAVVGPTAASFLTVFPADASPRPLAASLNWVAGQAPTPNAVTSALSADGKVSFYNLAGTVNLAVDVVGYYEPSTSGPAGPKGDTGPVGPAGPVNRISNAQIALKRWDQDPGRNLSGVSELVNDIAFDGNNIWVTTSGPDQVQKIDRSTGQVLATITGHGLNVPFGIAFDGTNLWVANFAGTTVTKINPTSATVVDTVTVGTDPLYLAFDGGSVWAANSGSGSVSKINATTDAVTGPFPVGTSPGGIAFDGIHIWVANVGSSTLSKIDPTDNAVLNPASLLSGIPLQLAFDGQYLWITEGNSVRRIDPVSNSYVGAAVGVGNFAQGIAFDGRYLWVQTASNLVRVDRNLNTSTVISAANSTGIAFDGTNIWYTASGPERLTKLTP